MASIILSDTASSLTRSAFTATGINSIPFVGKRITSAATSLTSNVLGGLGRQIDAKLFGSKTVNRNRGSRLTDLQVQSSAYGEYIHQLYGTTRIAGNIIWSRPIKESTNVTVVNSSSGGKGGGGVKVQKQTETRYTYSVSVAIGLCEGVIDDVIRIWADAKVINPADYSIAYRIYKGSESQNPDSLIEAFEGIGKTPAYRGLAYIVFEDFQLAEFGNRIPNFTFEVRKNYKNSLSGGQSAEELVKCVNLIPGCGEFVYDTIIQSKILGEEFEGTSGPDIFIQSGKQQRINHNTYQSRADVLLALDDLQKTFPNLEYISIVCSWFGDSMNAADCIIKPGVEQNTGIATTPSTWSAGGYDRPSARLISRDADDRPNYGGTPSDSSIINLVTEIKARGLKVMFYPMLFMDVAGKPWRGDLTGSASSMAGFFTRSSGYNEFITYYADLLKNKVDAFIIGSELKGLTSVKDGSNNFPAVTQLAALAATVKSIMGSSTKITYAADWSEYHSSNGWYNLDALWASPNIDVIGIDAYFPLTDAPQNGNYNINEVISGWTNGEGYNWYYTDSGRTNKASLAAAYAWKNIAYWWNNTHTNPNGTTTSWVPASKKIWFTEYGFPSTDGATNQPNVFYNPESVAGSLPRFSKGAIDYQAQRLGIEATELAWQSSTMVENKFLWCFDARPYPYWPDLKQVWSDGNIYQLGHWVNGKFNSSGLAEVMNFLGRDAGIDSSMIDTSNISINLDGFTINSKESNADIIKALMELYFINAVEVDGKISFGNNPQDVTAEIDSTELVVNNKQQSSLQQNIISETELPAKYELAFLNRNTGYLAANEIAENSASSNIETSSNKVPVVLETALAKRIAEISLKKQWSENELYQFSLPQKYSYLNTGDQIKLDGNNLLIRQLEHKNGVIDIFATKYDGKIYDLAISQYEREQLDNTDPVADELVSYILDLPCLPQNNDNDLQIHFAVTSKGKFNGAEVFVSNDNGVNYSKISNIIFESVLGTCLTTLDPASPYLFDDKNQPEIILLNGELESKNDLAILNGANAAIIGDEIVQFSTAELIGENKYRLKGLLRGRLGTENKIALHGEAERFILLNPLLVSLSASLNQIGQTLLYKIVPSGKTLLDVAPLSFTYNANSLKPISVVNAKQIKLGNDISISWNRRCRNNGDLKNFVDIPLLESSEKYEVDILNGSGTVLRTVSSTAPEINYAEAQQITDFGAVQSFINANIYQISEIVGRGAVTTI